MLKFIKASIEINQELEFEFKIGVEYTLNKDWDDFQVWGALELYNTWIEGLTDAECEAILNGEITCFYSEDLEENSTDIDWLFGDEAEFREAVKKYRDGETNV